MTIKTYEDGWDCVPELKDVVEAYKNMKGAIYEIENCVRDRDLPSLVGELQECLEDMFNHLDNIDTDREFETVDYDGE
tara:strand:+ start:2607 stop:2840 length:234 start_codon:yes stop_codon:yes gene_type:complete